MMPGVSRDAGREMSFESGPQVFRRRGARRGHGGQREPTGSKTGSTTGSPRAPSLDPVDLAPILGGHQLRRMPIPLRMTEHPAHSDLDTNRPQPVIQTVQPSQREVIVDQRRHNGGESEEYSKSAHGTWPLVQRGASIRSPVQSPLPPPTLPSLRSRVSNLPSVSIDKEHAPSEPLFLPRERTRLRHGGAATTDDRVASCIIPPPLPQGGLRGTNEFMSFFDSPK